MREITALRVAATLCIALAACARSNEPPKVPLGQTSTAEITAALTPVDPLPPAARAALDTANAEFRDGRFTTALDEYRRAAKLAPQSAAPFFGIYMAARKLGRSALADSATREIAARSSPSTPMLSDSAMRRLHAK
jgi:hypothetical protein